MLYDKLLQSVKDNDICTQPLLVPYILNTSYEESAFLDNKLDYFNNLGIEIENFGTNSYRINAIPLNIINIDLKIFFEDLLNDMDLLKNNDLPEIIKDKIAQKACKSAIKSGDNLTEGEINYLLALLNGNLGLKCPHGRPICIKISRTEIDKWFKRIV